MKNVKENLSDLIGNTPMLEVKTVRPDWMVYLKLEYFSPAGSFKTAQPKP
ncbi:MAG: hypothetical protein R3B65_03515 [Candidatus Paceibacterota bacterium]